MQIKKPINQISLFKFVPGSKIYNIWRLERLNSKPKVIKIRKEETKQLNTKNYIF